MDKNKTAKCICKMAQIDGQYNCCKKELNADKANKDWKKIVASNGK